MAAYLVQNQWGGSQATWNPGGLWLIGARDKQNVVALDIKSDDGGKTLKGTMTYNGEGPIGFRGTLSSANNYTVENQWGGTSAPWQPGGVWVLGARDKQNIVAVSIKSNDGGKTLTGTTTYNGEGPIGFKSEVTEGDSYSVENQWGGSAAPWHTGGVWVLGTRGKQNVINVDAKSNDGGKTLSGTMTYNGEGPIGFRGTLTSPDTYTVENQWGGSTAPWNPGGFWMIGARNGQNVVALNVASSDGGKTLAGTMVYNGEGPIGFRARLG
ncbi:lectin ESA-2 [Myxococcus xanthus]|uniref:lectin OAA family protein n=1 Tax=Myxococcus xanthus TaxID=34 RepID=UPI00112D5D9F|nr:lectin ESA-2 [Myxococcus xanthus]QDE93514.1 lectin ESA-2 [Myxococcus xanthus]